MTTSDPAPAPTAPPDSGESKLKRQLGLFDATMVVMGGIVGSGIFINPYVVAQRVHTGALIIGAWVAGGVLALLGAFIYAELADRMPAVGGQYAYLSAAYHPALGFLYGWVLLLVIQTGGMATVIVTFARYFLELTHMHASEPFIGILALAVLTVINCAGVKVGSGVQSALMVMKIAAIFGLIWIGFQFIHTPAVIGRPLLDRPPSFNLVAAFGAAMIPVLFAYGGWQTANFLAGEIKEPRKNLSRALLIGVAGVVGLYVGANVVYARALGPAGLADSHTPATAVMRLALGQTGATLIAIAITISTLGFLSQSILTAPRVYFAMAEDGTFFPAVAYVSPSTRVPIVAIVLQSIWTSVIALSGRYEQIMNYVVAMDFLFFGLTASCLFVFHRRERQRSTTAALPGYRVPGHPVTTLIFIAVSWLVVINTIYQYPSNSLIGMGILLLGLPAYWLWQTAKRAKQA